MIAVLILLIGIYGLLIYGIANDTRKTLHLTWSEFFKSEWRDLREWIKRAYSSKED